MQKGFDDFFRLFAGDLPSRFKDLDSLVDWEKDESLNIKKLSRLLDNWQAALRDLILFLNHNEAGLANLKTANAPEALKAIGWERIINADLMLHEAKNMFGFNISSKNILENVIINL